MRVMIGDIFSTSASTIVNTVNCVGVMGKGIALEFKKKYPRMFEEYKVMCENGMVHPGEPYYYSDLLGNSIINFPTKDHWKSPSRLSYITNGLEWFVHNYQQLGIQSIAFPPLGCGNGGLSWDVVGPVMYRYLHDLPIEVTVFAPYGTKAEQLTDAFLRQQPNSPREVTGAKRSQLNTKWLLILQAVKELNGSKYSLRVGRIIFQKICYVLTRTGVNTGFVFSKGSYGPYSKEVAEAVKAFSNANLIVEHPYKQMVVTYVNPDFKLNRDDYSPYELSCLERTVDLFSRIKFSKQAEIIATVLFAADELNKKEGSATEQQIYDYIIDWKPDWASSYGRIVKETIRNAAASDWIKAVYCEEFIIDDMN